MDTKVSTIGAASFEAVEGLIDSGRLGDAAELLAACPSGPESRLLEGAIMSYSRPESAKDLLSEGTRLVGGRWRERGMVWLASCYWATGEKKEARATLDSFKPTDQSARFVWHLLQSIIESGSLNLKYALRHLKKIESLVDSVNPVWRGKFFNERGFIYRRLGNVDESILAYEGARISFEEAENPSALAAASVNLAAVYCDVDRFAEAHKVLDHAIRILRSANNQSYLAQALDQKAVTFIYEKRFGDAKNCAEKALGLLIESEKQEWYGESLVTLGRAEAGLEKWTEAFDKFREAQRLADILGSDDLQFKVAGAYLEASEILHDRAESDRITIALRLSDGSCRSAAQKLGIYHSALRKAMNRRNIMRTPKRPPSLKFKPLN